MSRARAVWWLPPFAAITVAYALECEQDSAPVKRAAAVDFARDVKPILDAKCVACHGPDKRKGGLRLDDRASASSVLVVGQSAESEIVKRLVSGDDDERMPRDSDPLPDHEIALLRRWIDEEAVWPDEFAVPATRSSHWAYQAPRGIVPPTPRDSAGLRNPIDAFVRAQLEERGLVRAPEADRATLLRRVHLDLTGLPPTPEEVRAFTEDRGPNAYDRVVDHLLASPRHAERMTQWWLDLARYADTNGYEKDSRRTMWRWRDWVLEAFQQNMPFDQFTLEQLAGDLLPNATLEQRIATGFHRNTQTNEEGGVDPEEYRMQAVIDRVNTTSTVWLGTSMACVQCHNHKFDPFSQREYYELLAFFNTTQDAGNQFVPVLRAPTKEQAEAETKMAQRVQGLEAALDAPDAVLDAEEAAWRSAARTVRGAAPAFTTLHPSRVSVTAGGEPTVRADGVVLAQGAVPDRVTYTLSVNPPPGRVEVVRIEALEDPSLPHSGPGRSANGNFVLTNVELATHNASLTTARALRSAHATFEQSLSGRHRAIEAIDSDPKSGWAVWRGAADVRSESIDLVPTEQLRTSGETTWTLRIECESPFEEHVLGAFRVSVSDSAEYASWIAPPRMGPWCVTEPLPVATQATGLASELAPEQELRTPLPPPTTVRPGWTERPEWRDGDYNPFEGENRVWYLERRVIATEAMRLLVHAGGDDAFRFLVNGVQVFESAKWSDPVVDQHSFEIALPLGESRLALKLVNGGGATGFYFDASRETSDRLPADLQRILARPDATDEEERSLRAWFRRNVSERGKQLARDLDAARKDLDALRATIPSTPVLVEQETLRETHILSKGSFLSPGERVTADTPGVLPPISKAAPLDRVALARWIMSTENPLTARVLANRVWALVFGRGIVATLDDFGTRGEAPTHPELLDWLAQEFVASHWDLRAFLKLIVTSATYRQSSDVTALALEKDPDATWLGRMPRSRLEGETLRDVALAVSGLLVEEVGGPSVMPPQPDGIWSNPYSSDSWTIDTNGNRYRRGLYTFWRRTAPYATFMLFDAPSRELTCTRRARTNTPLQALALLNDPAFVECAAGLAARMLVEGPEDARGRLALGFQLCTARAPNEDELAVLANLLASEQGRLSARPEAAHESLRATATAWLGREEGDPIERAAFVSVANVLLNLDETVTRN